MERIAREYAQSKWSGEVIAIHSNVVRRGKLHEVNGLVRVPYTEKKGGQTRSSDSVFYGGYAECIFKLQIRFDGKVVGYKKEQPDPSPPGSTVGSIPVESTECESTECYSYPLPQTPQDFLDRLADNKLKDAKAKYWEEKAKTEKHKRGDSRDNIFKKFGL